MLKAAIKIVAWGAFVVAVVGLLAFNALLIWIATGTRSLDKQIPYIERALAPEGSDYSVHIGTGLLLWDGWRNPVDIRLKQVDVLTKEGVRFASFPDVSLGISFWALPFGQVLPRALTVRNPVVSLYQQDDGKVSFGIKQEGEEPQPGDNEGKVIETVVRGFISGEGGGVISSLRQVNIVNADVSVGRAGKGVLLHAQKVNFSMHRGFYSIALHGSVTLAQGEKRSPMTFDFDLSTRSKDKPITGTYRLRNIWPDTLLPLLPERTELAMVQVPISGWGSVVVLPTGELQELRYTMQTGAGEVRTEFLDGGTLGIKQVQLEGALRGTSELTIEHASAELEGATLQGKAKLLWQAGQMAVQAQATARGVAVKDVRSYWPPSLGPMSRAWVVENITDGLIPQASIVLNTNFGDFEKTALPKEAVDATIVFEKARVRYLPEHAPITDAFGVIRLDGQSLEVNADRARAWSDTRLSNGRVWIEDLTLDNPRIEVSFLADAAARDIVEFLSHPPANHAEHLQLSKDAAGRAAGSAKLGFYYEVPLGPNGKPREDLGIDYEVVAKVTGAAQQKFMGKFDISNANGNVKLDNNGIAFDGTGSVNGATADAKIAYTFQPQNGVDLTMEVAGTAPVSSLPRFGYPEFKFLSGTLGVKATLRQGDKVDEAKAAIDLRNTAIHWEDMHWHKQAGVPGTLLLTTERQENRLMITSLNLDTPDTKVEGSAGLNDAMAEFTRLNFSTLKLGKNNLVLDYVNEDGMLKLHAKGASGDLSPWMKGTSDFSFKNFPALDLDVDVASLTVGDGREVKALKGKGQCSKDLCSSVNVTGEAGGKPFTFYVGKTAGKRTVTLTAKDAGALLHAFDVYDNMKGGELAMGGVYDDAKPGRPVSGSLKINDFTIENAPVLTKLLSLASLSGIVDTLQGKGIGFVTMKVPYTLENDVITIKDFKMHGSEVGLTADGTISFPGQKLAIEGTVVPSYTLNTVLGNVPIIGDILTGGKGEGIFAARYSVSGNASAPDVSVNPLSILTPGFLRGLFDIGDSGPNASKATSPESSAPYPGDPERQ